MTLRYVAPAGAPIGVGDLLRWTRALLTRRDGRHALRAAVEARFGARRAYLTCTGRAGLTVLMRALRQMASSEADEVIVPAYTCYSVPASIVRAGLRVRLVDIDPDTLDYDRAALEATDARRVLALVATNLYGTPNDLPYLVDYGRRHELFVVDDAAQAMGAVSSGRPAGTWGDAGLYSLDKGKNVSAIDGGILVTSSDALAATLDAEMLRLAQPGTLRRAEHLVKALVYAALLHPRVYWIPNAIPQLGLGRTVYTTDFAVEADDPSLASLAAVMFAHLEDFTTARRERAARLMSALAGYKGLSIPQPGAESVSAWLRLPVLCDDPQARERLLADLNGSGIGATLSYPAALGDVPDLQASLAGRTPRIPGARSVASRVLTLPTHPHVSERDIETIASVVARVAGHHRVSAAMGAVAP